MKQKPKIYIDGQSGTTGLQIVSRISARDDLELLLIDDDKRHDDSERARFFNMADVAFLCLPDKEAIHAVSLVQNPNTCIIDASTAHRCCDDWVYGLPELSNAQREAIANSKRIANPGCHATGFITAIAPLVSCNILPKNYPLTCFSITGYSGGGKKMIAEYDAAKKAAAPRLNWEGKLERVDNFGEHHTAFNNTGSADNLDAAGNAGEHHTDAGRRHTQLLSSPGLYGLNMQHKHLPEMQKMCNLDNPPAFVPIVANYYEGMATSIILHNKLLNGVSSAKDVHKALEQHYQKTSGNDGSANGGSTNGGCANYGSTNGANGFTDGNGGSDNSNDGFIQVRPFSKEPPTIYAAELAKSAKLELFVSGNEEKTCIISIFDNLGKGASAAAVQNMNIALGLPEATGL